MPTHFPRSKVRSIRQEDRRQRRRRADEIKTIIWSREQIECVLRVDRRVVNRRVAVVVIVIAVIRVCRISCSRTTGGSPGIANKSVMNCWPREGSATIAT